MTNKKWNSINNNIVSYPLDKIHNLYIIRTTRGIEIRVLEEDGKLRKPKVMFVRSISNSQLGYVK